MGALVAGNLALLGALTAAVLAWPDSGALPLNSRKMEQARMAPAATLASGRVTPVQPAASEAMPAPPIAAAVSAIVAPAPTTVPEAPTPALASRTSQGPVQALPQKTTAKTQVAQPVAPAPAEAKMPKIEKPITSEQKSVLPSAGKYRINVGVFAQANNARNTYAKLLDAGLPAQSEEINASTGPRTRIRVGPYDTKAEADSAAEAIRALRLDAAVFKD
jgi:cell division protein FtsN